MKITIISIIILFIIVILAQVYSTMSTTRTEQHKYEVLKSYAQFEIRKYEPALFSSIMLGKNSYREISSKGFSVLAGYIFGGNSKKQSIAIR
jgi:hypothetical protein